MGAVLTFAATAEANQQVVCERADYLNYFGRHTYRVAVNGNPLESGTFTTSHTVHLPPGDKRVTMYADDRLVHDQTYDCTPEVTTTPVVPVTPVTPVTPTPVKPTPRKRKPPVTRKPPRKITCGYLKLIGAGPREYTKRGWYYKCRIPVSRPPAGGVPVTG